ncbi:uncharacterized protein N0V89_003861 [Didymosphaeria variabile]|uniref:Uncharacterized protein n=1 Tax=Didymosphaeria variabile TaxID=1932322 RepID=A0A9W9CCM6_9PLEO|nr:uncharacterized protein N0V89_003861 [Didymosphaeria variabile]KAJ4355840.1 hypothetical protein N0V89_003861 [Didymosphaeria variabile]
MKFTTSTFLTTAALVTARVCATSPSPDTVYQIRLSSSNSAINDAVVTVKTESPVNTSPNALGIFSTGEPRNPYTFKFLSSSLGKFLYELQGTIRQTHLVLTGKEIALGLYDNPIGADPKPAEDEMTVADKWWILEKEGKMTLMVAARYTRDNSSLNRLEDYVKGCEGGITLYVEEAKSSPTASGYLTGVTAPAATPTGYTTGVSAPNLTAAGGAKPTSPTYEASAARVAFGTLVGLVGFALADVL